MEDHRLPKHLCFRAPGVGPMSAFHPFRPQTTQNGQKLDATTSAPIPQIQAVTDPLAVQRRRSRAWRLPARQNPAWTAIRRPIRDTVRAPGSWRQVPGFGRSKDFWACSRRQFRSLTNRSPQGASTGRICAAFSQNRCPRATVFPPFGFNGEQKSSGRRFRSAPSFAEQ